VGVRDQKTILVTIKAFQKEEVLLHLSVIGFLGSKQKSPLSREGEGGVVEHRGGLPS